MLHTAMTRKEVAWGWGYLLFQLFLLPSLMMFANGQLPRPLDIATLNFLFFLVNFLAVILIFRRFLKNSFQAILPRKRCFLNTVLLGYLLYVLWLWVFALAVTALRPQYANLNDQTMFSLLGKEFWLMVIGTVVLVPPVEETFYRGLIFGRIFPRSPLAAYGVSAAAFCLIHIMGFLGVYSTADFLLAFLQYLPAGLILAWSYQHTGTLFTPVLIHALINLRGIWLMR